MRLELSLQNVFNRDECAGTGDLDVTTAALEVKDANLIATYSQIDHTPVTFGHTLPGDNDTSVGKRAHAVLVRTKLGDPARALQLALMVELLGKGKEETFFAVASKLVSE